MRSRVIAIQHPHNIACLANAIVITQIDFEDTPTKSTLASDSENISRLNEKTSDLLLCYPFIKAPLGLSLMLQEKDRMSAFGVHWRVKETLWLLNESSKMD